LIALRQQLEGTRVGAGIGFGQGEGGDGFPGRERGDPARDLLGGARQQDWVRTQGLDRDRVLRLGGLLRKRLAHQAEVPGSDALGRGTARRLWEEQAEQTMPAERAEQAPVDPTGLRCVSFGERSPGQAARL